VPSAHPLTHAHKYTCAYVHGCDRVSDAMTWQGPEQTVWMDEPPSPRPARAPARRPR
jgi:hypothetical protein